MRIVLDTNVFISALVSTRSAPAAILDLWRAREIELLTSVAVLAEYQRVLTYPKVRKRLSLIKSELDAVFEMIAVEGTFIEPQVSFKVVLDDPSDNKFIDLAVAGKATFLVSGDRHLLKLQQFQEIPIVNPMAFMAAYQDQEWSTR